MSNGWTYTYTWSNRGQMLEERTQGYPVRTFVYDAAGRMTEATVFTLTTRFRYNGDGARLAVEVEGQGTTSYTIDYAGGYRVLAEETLTETVSYLYGHDCLGEQRDDEWLYYLNDAAGYVRQGAGEQGQVESAWLFDPDGLVIFGPKGPVSHLVCGGVYDWSTGLIFKGNRYFDPSLGIWLSLAPLVVLQGGKRGKKRRWWHQWMVMLLLLSGVSGMLVGCTPPTGTTQTGGTEVCTVTETETPGSGSSTTGSGSSGNPPTPVPPTVTPTPPPTIFERNHYVKGLTPAEAEKYHQQQTTNDCGPYSAAIAANIYQGASNFQGSDFAKNMKGRMPGGYTPPEAMAKHLQEEGVPSQVKKASKEEFLKSLDNGSVIVMLFTTPHWVVLYGYEPNRTININGTDVTGPTWGTIDPGQTTKLSWWPESYLAPLDKEYVEVGP